MLLSIVIPTYNRAHLILSTLHSVLMQTYPNFEVIVVDDGSKDNTGEVVNAIGDKRIRYYKKDNEERAAARNYGTLKAKGDYITFLDSDDILLPHFLGEAVKMIRKERSPEWFHIRYRITDDQNQVISERLIYKEKSNSNKRLFYEGNFISCIGVFLRRDIALANLFNPDRRLIISEDHELWLRIAAQYPLRINDTVSANLIHHETRSVTNFQKEMLITGKELSLQLILQNPQSKKYVEGHEHIMRSACYSYIALHLALTGHYKREAISYTIKALINDLSFSTSRRFFAIIKHLSFTY